MGLRLRKLTFTGVWSLHVGYVAKAEDRPDEVDGLRQRLHAATFITMEDLSYYDASERKLRYSGPL